MNFLFDNDSSDNREKNGFVSGLTVATVVDNVPTHPCIIGALWSGKAQPPQNNADGNNDWRVIKTRANTELNFFDGDPPSVELKLEDGKRLFMDDKIATLEDGQGNLFKIEAESGAISIVASGDMTLEGKSVTINSSSTVDIVASGTMTLQGATIQIN